MKAIDILKQAHGTRLENEDGIVEELRLLPGLSAQELKDLAAQLPCPLPDEARAVLSRCRGFEDLRHPKTGDGFSWGRYGPKTINKRFGEKRLFAYQIRESFWQRWFRK